MYVVRTFEQAAQLVDGCGYGEKDAVVLPGESSSFLCRCPEKSIDRGAKAKSKQGVLFSYVERVPECEEKCANGECIKAKRLNAVVVRTGSDYTYVNAKNDERIVHRYIFPVYNYLSVVQGDVSVRGK